MTILGDLRIVDLTGDQGAYAGKLLGDLGAEVVRLVGPEGDPLAGVPPIAGPDDLLGSLSYQHYLTGRRSVVVDPQAPDGARTVAELLQGADALLESLATPGRRRWGVEDHRLHADHPGLVHVSISGYGRTGPLAEVPWTEITAAAAGGLLYLIGEPDRPPVQLGGHQLYHLTAMYAAAAVLMGIRRSWLNGRGACVDLSMQEVAFSITGDRQPTIVQALTGVSPRRTGNQTPHFYPYRNFPCHDGWVTICALEPKQWAALSEWIAEATGDGAILDPRFGGRGYDRVPYADELGPLIRAFCMRFDKRTLYIEGQARGIPIMPASSVADLLVDPQLEARNFFQDLTLGTGRTVRIPGRPYRLNGGVEPIHAAPEPGGERAQDLGVRAVDPPAPDRGERHRSWLPLEGIRVVEVGWYVAAPWIGIQMARQGAEVIKVETSKSVDIMRRVPIIDDVPTGADYASFGGGKRSITLDVRTTEGRELLQRLVGVSDVVTENFSLEAGRRFGLDWRTISEANPRAILLRMPGFGLDGPTSEFVSYGMAMAALAGLDLITGYEDGPPGGNSISYPDYVAAHHGLVAILAALHDRERTGRGQQIELSQFESAVTLLGPAFLDYQINGVVAGRHGNRNVRWAPQGVYPALGDDRWFALSIRTDAEWAAFARILPGRMTAAALSTVDGRRAAQSSIDEQIAEWGRSITAEAAVETLRSLGVAASVVATAADILGDPQLAARRFLRRLDVPGYGTLSFARSPITLDRATGLPHLPHRLGQDNKHVFQGLLGLGSAEYRARIEEGVIL
jgi:crotonobetainyl-CoA:carnitine CoA-transferase CaiB-like acyl-CoA transferase